MPIVASDIQRRLSGGAANADLDASLGGAKSSESIVNATIHNLFDQVSGAESAAGDTEYRCFYFHNAHATLTLEDAEVFIQSQTDSGDTSVEIAVGSSGVNGTEQTIADEETAPTGVTFTALVGSANALPIGDIPPGQHIAIWVKRIVSTGAAAYSGDSTTIRLVGDTAA